MQEALKEAQRLVREADKAAGEGKREALARLFELVYAKEPALLAAFLPTILRFRAVPDVGLRCWVVSVMEQVCERHPDRAPPLARPASPSHA